MDCCNSPCDLSSVVIIVNYHLTTFFGISRTLMHPREGLCLVQRPPHPRTPSSPVEPVIASEHHSVSLHQLLILRYRLAAKINRETWTLIFILVDTNQYSSRSPPSISKGLDVQGYTTKLLSYSLESMQTTIHKIQWECHA